MKKLIFILMVLMPLGAEELIVLESRYSPGTYYVGDDVILRITAERPYDGVIKAPDTLPASAWLEIKSINIIDNEDPEVVDIRISFTSYAPGLRSLPDLTLGDHTVKDFKIQTMSLTEERFSEMTAPRKQALLPGTRLFLAGLIAGILFIPLILFFLIRNIIKAILLAARRYRRERPFRHYVKTLKKLKLQVEDDNIREFYIHLTENLKHYLSVRFSDEYSSATTRDMETLLPDILDEEYCSELIQICHFADLVKFSSVSMDHRKDDLKRTAKIIYLLEDREVPRGEF